MTVFGVTLEELLFRRLPKDPGAVKAMLAAEVYLLAVRKLETDPGESPGNLAALRVGILGLAAAEPGGAAG